VGARADKRVALVIGNGAYANAAKLPNPPRDAEDAAAALKRIGFDVVQGIDLGHAGMQDAVIRFARAAQSADVGIFYYSGHALQFNGINYLMPVDANLSDEADLYRFTRVDDILGYLQQVKALTVLVLDSCRDNPLAEILKRSIGLTRAASIQRGLARIEAPIGTIISYSTQAGQTAIDGKGRNSPYTAAFLKHIEEPREIGDIFRDISADVYRATGETQLPELSLSIIGQFYLKGPISQTVNLPPPSTPVDPCAAAGDHWKSAEAIGSLVAFEDHLARFPACTFAGLAKARIDALKTKVAVVAPPPTGPPRTQKVVAAPVIEPMQPVHPAAPHASSEQVDFVGSLETKKFDCFGGKVKIVGGHNVVTIVGKCSNLDLTGTDNKIIIDFGPAAKVNIVGGGNTIIWTSTDGRPPTMGFANSATHFSPTVKK
jgi:hypothetical protein